MDQGDDTLCVPFLVPIEEGAPPSAWELPSIWQQLETRLEKCFEITKRGSTLSTELRAGTTAFLACSNNFIVNAHIMKHAGIDPGVSVVSGAFAAAVTCISSGFLSNLPLGIVPSVGPNVFLAFSLVASRIVSLEEALAISAASGLLLFALSLTPVLKLLLGLMPLSIKYGLIMGTGLLTTFIGLKSIGVVVPDTSIARDIVAMGQLNDVQVRISALFLLIMSTLLFHGIKGAVLGGMLGATLTYWVVSGNWPSSLIAIRCLTLHDINLGVLVLPHAWVQVGALLLMLLFSISGAVIGCARMAGVLREDGSVPGRNAVYICCGLGTIISAALGSAPIFVSMSAAAGIRDGGRTGLVSVVVGIYSLLTAFVFSPLASAIPSCAVAPVLILVGLTMLGEAKEVQWWSMIDALPAFLCAVFQPFTYSVSNGIYAGIVASFMLFFTTGDFLNYLPRRKQALPERMEQKAEEKTEQTGGSVPTSPLLPVPHQSPWTCSPVPSLRDQACEDEKGTVSRIGFKGRRQAMNLIKNGCKLLGLDTDEITKVVEARMEGGARSAEEHFMGGISCHEVEGGRLRDFLSLPRPHVPTAGRGFSVKLKRRDSMSSPHLPTEDISHLPTEDIWKRTHSN